MQFRDVKLLLSDYKNSSCHNNHSRSAILVLVEVLHYSIFLSTLLKQLNPLFSSLYVIKVRYQRHSSGLMRASRMKKQSS